MTDIEKVNIEFIRNEVNKIFSGDNSGHDEYHILRVTNMSVFLAKANSANEYICSLAALLHEYDDAKFIELTGGKENARKLLQKIDLNAADIDHVIDIISNLSFKGEQKATPMKTIEGMCVQDADRLDAIGAIGIARTFSFSGAKNRAIYNPLREPQTYTSDLEYHNTNSSAIAHFYEKLLLLKDRMNTAQAIKIANDRHNFMLQFLEQFYKDWKGEI